MPDRLHLLVAAGLAVVAAVAVLLALTATPWALLAVPVCLVGGVAAWTGMSLGGFADAVGSPEDDAGRGVPGMLP